MEVIFCLLCYWERMSEMCSEEFDYSVVFRTLGQGGSKYEALVQSINRQTILPREVVIVIPDGYSVPEVHAMNERIVRSEKGMVIQRIVGMEEARSEY